MTRHNLNDHVLVHITTRGLELLRKDNEATISNNEHLPKSVKEIIRDNIPKVEKEIDGRPFYKMQLHKVMDSFGHLASTGAMDSYISMTFYTL